MSAVEALKAARTAGIQLRLDGDDLVLEASAPPPAAILDQLSRHKPGIVALLRPGRDGWSAEDWQVSSTSGPASPSSMVVRRAPRPRPAPSPAASLNGSTAISCALRRGHCLACGGREHAHDPLLPYGVEPPGHAWLHSRCWPAWYRAREDEARAALSSLGIRA